MRSFFLMTIFISIIRMGYAQTDSIQYEIENNHSSKSMLIKNGRILLLDVFLSKDIEKTSKIANFLTTKLDNEDYISLLPIEQWLIKYWTKDYEHLIQSIRQFESIYPTLRMKVQPPNDNLLSILRDKSYNQRMMLINSITESSIPNQEKEFLILHLNSCLISNDTRDITQETLNDQADNFILKYPNSELIYIIRKYIRYKLIASNWGFSFDFFSGYGIFSNNLSSHFSNNIPIGAAIDVYYKNVAFYLRYYAGFSFTKHDFTNGSEIWIKDSQVRVFLPEASLGYVIYNSEYLKLAPFAGISSTNITPTGYDLGEKPGLKAYELTHSTTYTIGFNVDIKLGKSPIAMVSYEPEESYWFVRIRYAYNFPQFSKSYTGFEGHMQYITIGIGGFGSTLKIDN